MSRRKSSPSAIVTRVGHAGEGDNEFCGRDVGTELVGRASLWSLVSIASGGPELSDEQARVWDDVATCILAPDPRIWIFKLTHLVAATGGLHAGIAMGSVVGSSDLIGPNALRGCVDLITLAHDARSDKALERSLRAVLRRNPRLAGFGTPLREEDERFRWLRQVVKKRRLDRGEWWRALERLLECAAGLVRAKPNAGIGIAAIGLDQGLTVDGIEMMTYAAMVPQYIAHAFESARSRPQLLRQLAPDMIEAADSKPRRGRRPRKR